MGRQSKLVEQAFGIAHHPSTERTGREELKKLKQELEQVQAENEPLKWAHKMVLNDWKEEQARVKLYRDFLKHHFGISLTFDSNQYD